MASAAASSPRRGRAANAEFWPWFRQVFISESAPYPGRVNTVARMVVAATLVMLVTMTFRIPGAALAGYYAILLTRDNLAATWKQGVTFVLAFGVGTLYTILSMMLVRDYPVLQFFWVIGTLYLIFFVIRTMPNYGAAAGFSFLIANAIPLWDRFIPVEAQLESTLWQTAVVAMGAGVTILAEVVYRIFSHSNPTLSAIDGLLDTASQITRSVARHQPPPHAVRAQAIQYSMVGTGRLRTTLLRQGVAPARRAYLSALIALVGRLIDLATTLDSTACNPTAQDTTRLLALSRRLEEIRTELRESGVIVTASPEATEQPSPSVPLLPELERTVALITQVFHREEDIDDPLHQLEVPSRSSLFLPDAFHNRDYHTFAFAGCLAASICYILYNALNWPGISTSVATCIITALTNIGTSRQKQVLRLGGAIVGGLIIGIPAQVFILPNLDGIFGYTLFFAAGTAIAAWFATSSPRLSYFGMQIALAFYIINFENFSVPTNLTPARDRVIGVLLGVVAMGLVFDRFGPKSAADLMRQLFVRTLRQLADLIASPGERERPVMIRRIRALRVQINDGFTSLAAQMDAVQFEFGPRRAPQLAVRERLQSAQPAMRSIYLLALAFLQYRSHPSCAAEFTGEQVRQIDAFLSDYTGSLRQLANAFDRDTAAPPLPPDPTSSLRGALDGHVSPHTPAILSLSRQMTASLESLHRISDPATPPLPIPDPRGCD